MPPFAKHMSNPALGYLKGFLQSREIDVKCVYWNLILARKLSEFRQGIQESEEEELSYLFPTLYIFRYLMTEKYNKKNETPLDLLYSSVFTREELSEIFHSTKDFIDLNIKQNSMHETLISGFTLKTFQWLGALYVSNRLKQINPDMKIIIGGIANETQGLTFMKMFESADFAIWGEGEYPLFHLITVLEENGDPKSVSNLIYREEKKILSTGTHNEYLKLDSYPFAENSDYFNTIETYTTFKQMLPSITIWGSRSCPWNRCNFCVLNEESPYRARSPENIIEEIKFQSEKHNINNFIFVDTEFPGSMKRFKKLLRLLIQFSADQKKRYHFYAEVSPIFINAETAHLMQLASFDQIQIGFEATTNFLLEKMCKRQKFAHNIQALKFGHRYRLKIRGLNILRGIPTETEKDIIKSCANLKFLRFLVNEFPLRPAFLKLWKGGTFFENMPKEERKLWKGNPFWVEINPIRLVDESDRFEFFGFRTDQLHHLWSTFSNLLRIYIQQNRSYEWIEYRDGSFVEEEGPKAYIYELDRTETDVLIFCDTIKSLSVIMQEFSHLTKDELLKIMHNLNHIGLLYFDREMNHVISIIDASERRKLFYM